MEKESFFDTVRIEYFSKLLVTGNYKVLKYTYYGNKENIYTRESTYGFKSKGDADDYILTKKQNK